MGRIAWGKTTAGVLFAAAVMGTSACGGSAEEPRKSAAAPKAQTVAEAAKTFQGAVVSFDANDGCPTAVGECWEQMQAIATPAQELRKAMNADKKTGPEFWTEAYVLLNKIEDGMAIGEDTFSNRPAVLGSAHDLADWLDEHPTE